MKTKHKKENKSLYIVRKYIRANSASNAIRLEKKCPVHDVWIDEEYKKTETGANAIGFVYDSQNEKE